MNVTSGELDRRSTGGPAPRDQPSPCGPLMIPSFNDAKYPGRRTGQEQMQIEFVDDSSVRTT
jgi:hypothetical protein